MRFNATLNVPIPRVAADAFAPCTYVFVLIALLFGGGARQGLWPDVVVEIAALPLLLWALFRLTPARLGPWHYAALALLSAILVLPLLQLIPLPPALWKSLPGRADVAAAYAAAAVDAPWLPLSLDPAATWRSLLALIPPAAVFLAMLSLERGARRVVLALILAVVFVSTFVDILQTMAGSGSPLRFYAITNPDRAVGFFANANHNAAFLYCAIPFAAAWMVGAVRDRRPHRVLVLVMLGTLVFLVMIGLALARSRAGVALACLAGLACLVLVWRHDRGPSGRRLMIGALAANAIALLIAFQFGFVAIMQRVEQAEVIEEVRWPAAAVTVKAATANMPFGTGFGTFVPVFEKYAPRTLLRERYVNHAHDDWLEIWLTGGIPALLLAAAFLTWFAGATAVAWRKDPRGLASLDVALVRAASIVIVLILAHSVLDYPLRTAAMSVWFAIACALLVPERTRGVPEPAPRDTTAAPAGASEGPFSNEPQLGQCR